MGKIAEIQLDEQNQKLFKKYADSFQFFYSPKRQVWLASERALSFAKEKGISFKIIKEFDAKESGIQVIRSFPAVLMDSPTNDAVDEAIAYALANQDQEEKPKVVYLGRNVETGDRARVYILDRAGGKRKYAWCLVESNEHVSEISIEQRFKKLLSIIKDPDTKFVISLGAGGLKVFAHSALFRFLDGLGVRDEIDEIWGTSGGSIAGLWYASGVSTREMENGGYDLYNEKFSLTLSASKFEVIKNIITHNLLPERFRPSGFAGFIKSQKSIHDFIVSLKKAREPKTPFFCIAFNLNTVKGEVLTPLEFYHKEYHDFIVTVDAIEAAVASSAVPILFVPKILKKKSGEEIPYIDGAISESIPIKSVYEKWLIDKKLGLEKRKKIFLLAAKVSPHNFINFFSEKVGEFKMLMIYQDIAQETLINSHKALFASNPDTALLELAVPLSEYGGFDIQHIPTFIRLAQKHYFDDLIAFEDMTTDIKQA